MANRLAGALSPYRRQHAGNPVDWYPWGEEALTRAREEDKPLLVSIGYSACHWCHVMERESFEDAATAAEMNARFVCVKVDREERPDVDAIYMEAVQAMTGRGGWPLNVFITPDQVPFFAGTYFPPEERHGLPSWRQVLAAIAEAWTERREEIDAQGADMAQRLSGGARMRPSAQPFAADAIDVAVAGLRASYDAVQGGWGGAPKFPAASVLELLLGHGETSMSAYTLTSMASGGIYDQLGGGFSRYAVDASWTVPHFEKMLYDNALLARAYLHGWLVTGDAEHRRVCVETLDWVLRELRGPEGAFMSALDADSEGVEGKFYVWTLDELRAVLDADDADAAIRWFGTTAEGNFAEGPAGANVLEDHGPRPDDAARARIRGQLLTARGARVRPGLDDKRLTAWNALMIAVLAEAGAALGEPAYVDAARTAADVLLRVHRDADGRLLRTSDGREARLAAYLEDHAFLLEALLVLYEATGEARWYAEARALADVILARFEDPEHGGFFATADDHERLVTRRKDLEDTPIPSGASSAALGLTRLAALSGEGRYAEAAAGQLRLLHEVAPKHPAAFAHLLQALALHLRPQREVAIVGPDGDARAALVAAVRGRFRPGVVLAVGDGTGAGGVPLLEGRGLLDGEPAAYVCESFACRRPVATADELVTLLD